MAEYEAGDPTMIAMAMKQAIVSVLNTDSKSIVWNAIASYKD
jgi:hypothetical protein